MGTSTVARIISETCDAIWEELAPIHLAEPTEDDWKQIEHGFNTKWNFPACCGSLDGKHVQVKCPASTVSQFFCYKGYFSIVLMALVDDDYKFVFVDIGEYGSNSDSTVWKNSNFGKAFIDGTLNIPPPKHLPPYPDGTPGGIVPHCFAGDEAFPQRIDLMRPYPCGNGKLPRDKAIFNYRLSRARHLVENAFGILAQRFQVFGKKMCMKPGNVDKVVKACCVLHNYLRGKKQYEQLMADLNPNDGPVRADALLDIRNLHGYHTDQEVLGIKNIFKAYFISPQGSVPWQDQAVYRNT